MSARTTAALSEALTVLTEGLSSCSEGAPTRSETPSTYHYDAQGGVYEDPYDQA